MNLVKCPRCDLNYMLDTEKLCSVCRKEVRGDVEQDDVLELCSECGENPVVPGQELCAACLKELSRSTGSGEEIEPQATTGIGMESLSGMEETRLDVRDDDLDGADFSEDEDEEDKDEEDSEYEE